MKNLKAVLWTLVGIVISAAAVLAASQAAPSQQKQQRLLVTAAGTAADNSAYFIKDSKSGACWLALKWTAAQTSVAPAPKDACD